MKDFGRVGRIKDKRNDCTFMVIGESESEVVRRSKSDFRTAIILTGVGFIREPLGPGDLGAVSIDSKDIEWLA